MVESVGVIPPSVFTKQPWGSRAGKTEAETVARNIMVIRKRNGDEWPLTWAQYEAGREKDGGAGCALCERGYFDEIIKMIPDAVGAIAFCEGWAEAARAYLMKQQKKKAAK